MFTRMTYREVSKNDLCLTSEILIFESLLDISSETAEKQNEKHYSV